jgi:hypothetical protein
MRAASDIKVLWVTELGCDAVWLRDYHVLIVDSDCSARTADALVTRYSSMVSGDSSTS